MTAAAAVRGRSEFRRGAAVLIVQNEEHARPGQLAPALTSRGLRPLLWQAWREEQLPNDPGHLAGLVVLGGGMDAWDSARYPHLVDVLRLIARAAEQDIPVLGLCLGAQLASLALGGRVSRRPDGFCIGWRPVVLANHDSLTAALPCCAELLHWHQDHFDLPPGSVPLMLGSDAFRLGSVAGIQAHPEVNVSLLRRWLARDGARDRLAQAKVTATEILEGAKRHDGHGAALLGAWATEVERRTERGTQLP